MLYVTLNCWFCNLDASVLFCNKNSWTCNNCKQYNGFNEDGDYNREIKEMHDINNNKNRFVKKRYTPLTQTSNGLCDHCNYYQQLKIDKLAEFKPRNEENYDNEIRNYKEYLEKIYELCEQCKSKVNFEITKQNGILKQYFLNLGNFDYFYNMKNKTKKNITESKLFNNINVKPSLNTHKKVTFSSIMSHLVRFVCFSTIFLLSTLIILYNNSKTNDPNHLQNSKLFIYLKDSILRFIFLNFDFDSIELAYNYINMNLLNCLIAIYGICCLLALEYKSNRSSFNFLATSSIWFIDAMIMILNYKQFMQMFNKNTFGPINRIDLGTSVFYLVLLIQTIILIKLISNCFNFLHKILTKNDSNKSQLFHDLKQIQQHQMKINLNKSDLTELNSNELGKIQFNYDLITPQTYTLMKYIQSRQSRLNDTNKIKDACSSSDIIRPSRFAPTDLNSKRNTRFLGKNSLDDSDRLSNNSELDDSDESSIISGLTNLYLNKTKAKSNLSIFETKPFKSNKSNATHLNGSLYQSSFYQEIPFNRTLISSSLNKKNSKSLLNLFKE